MPTWCRSPFNLFPSSCITCIFSSILSDGYHFVCSTQQSICHFDKLSCIYCNAHMIYMYIYSVLTSINSCFVHVQQHAPPWIAGAGHPCSDRSLFSYVSHIMKYKISTLVITESHDSTVWSIDFDATGSHLVSVSDDKTMKIWKEYFPGNQQGGYKNE